MKTAIAMYMPAPHQGCVSFINKYAGINTPTFLITESLIKELNPELESTLEKYLNALPSVVVQKMLNTHVRCEVYLLNQTNLNDFDEVIIPENDELVEDVLLRFYPSISLKREKGFIRWGRKTVLSERKVVQYATTSSNELDSIFMNKAFEVGQKSEDWWRQVGVVLKPLNHDPIYSFNHHLPHPYAPYIHGDPRSDFKPGEYIEYSTAIHAETGAIAYAARKGIPLQDASIYVTTFPCPNCARSIIEAGIKTVYYCEVYSKLDAIDIFRAAGVSLIFVDVPK